MEINFTTSGDFYVDKSAPQDERRITALAMVANEIDAEGDLVSPGELQAAAEAYLAKSRRVFLNHRVDLDGRVELTGSFIAPEGFRINGAVVPTSSWVVQMRVHDEAIWKLISNRTLKSLSVGGTAKGNQSGNRRELYNLDINEISLCEKGVVPRAKILALKSHDVPFLERPETIAALRAVAAELEDLKTIDALRRERDALLSQASARSKAPKRRPRFFDYDEWQAEQEYRNNREFDRNFHEHVRETEKHNRGKQTDYGR